MHHQRLDGHIWYRGISAPEAGEDTTLSQVVWAVLLVFQSGTIVCCQIFTYLLSLLVDVAPVNHLHSDAIILKDMALMKSEICE